MSYHYYYYYIIAQYLEATLKLQPGRVRVDGPPAHLRPFQTTRARRILERGTLGYRSISEINGKMLIYVYEGSSPAQPSPGVRASFRRKIGWVCLSRAMSLSQLVIPFLCILSVSILSQA